MRVRLPFAGSIPVVLRALIVLVGVMLPALALAQSAGPATFDHDQTGFPLTGAHASVICEGCHVSTAVMATPRQCSGCHNGGIAPGKPANHIRTTAQCDTCHNTVTYAQARFDHTGVTGACASCHDGKTASGKSAKHVQTTVDCGGCHNTGTWLGASINHESFTGNCASCHNGTDATGKAVTHIATSDQCASCHLTTLVWTGAKVDHTQVTGTCASCHTGTVQDAVLVTGKASTHIAANSNCADCHASTVTWVGATVNHADVLGTCASCHTGATVDGIIVTGKSATHLSTTADCGSCHNSTTTWLGAAGHPDTTGKTCFSCHDGRTSGASPKASTHIATTTLCESCHSSTAVWTGAKVDHLQVAGTCASCHTGATVDGIVVTGKASTHIALLAGVNCQDCHASTITWTGATVNHADVSGTCASCHTGKTVDGIVVTGRASTHIAITSGSNCADCHGSTTTWVGASTNHADVSGACASCHTGATVDGIVITGKSTTHIATTADCSSCHNSTTTWLGAIGHPDTTGKTCVSCHNGSVAGASPKASTHIASSTLCESCHSSTAVWTGAKVDHTQVTGACASCHTGASVDGIVVTGKAATHIAITAGANCADCHASTISWVGATVNHADVTGTCVSCHTGKTVDGVLITGKASTHIATNTNCSDCHTSTVTWIGALTNHADVIGTCMSCHNGATKDGIVVTGKSATHIATTADCSTCHTSTTSWLGAAFAHPAGTTNCVQCHVAGGAATTSKVAPPHMPTNNICADCHKSFTVWIGVGKPNHSDVVGTCASCHGEAAPATLDGVSMKLAQRGHHTNSDCSGCHNTNSF